MCGICGKIAFNDRAKPSQEELQAMRDILTRRGPDDAGIYIDGNVALCHRRLSIIDLEGSKQPLANENGTVWIVFNGEIYNFMELRDELIKLGHQFKTQGDTEVIVHLYEQYGEDSVGRLRGMFAFAIWDENKKELFMARDRVGKKPLHYYHDENTFIFGSEIKAILLDKYYAARKEMDLEAYFHYLSFLYVPAPLTIFKGIKKLLPAHWMKVDRNGSVETKQYWDVQFDEGMANVSESELCERLQHLLKEAVRIRLISDVPLGAFLSGGMDSSTVVAMMSKVSNAPIKTFSIGFSVDKYNEANDAREVANYIGTDHTEVILEPNDIIDQLQPTMAYFDEPFADSSLIPTYLVSRLAREKVTVALSGDGGDELFGGYPWWQKRPRYQLEIIKLPNSMKSLISSMAPMLPDKMRGKNFLSKLTQTYERYLLETKAVYDSDFVEFICSSQSLDALSSINLYKYNLPYFVNHDGKNWSDTIMEYDLKTYIPNDILTKVDRMSMFCSLEARAPLLDHKFVEFAAQIPARLKFKNNTSKYILKKAMEGILPTNILHKRKQGFSIPLEDWLRKELKEQMLDTILCQECDVLFNKKNVEKMIHEFLNGNDNHKHRLWVLFTFCSWHRAHFA